MFFKCVHVSKLVYVHARVFLTTVNSYDWPVVLSEGAQSWGVFLGGGTVQLCLLHWG